MAELGRGSQYLGITAQALQELREKHNNRQYDESRISNGKHMHLHV